ncbi:hypothetical protein B0H16DRAFT_1482389 [Mycena metata]|uniref:Uncharacterized protein n=1 Tax=Mycena metata TaxID=1033252 RepID=A0AAD7GTT4_9AGAR|nr:hypothetical protein B0H16DRAFT_1482389 [Mycena metata]
MSDLSFVQHSPVTKLQLPTLQPRAVLTVLVPSRPSSSTFPLPLALAFTFSCKSAIPDVAVCSIERSEIDLSAERSTFVKLSAQPLDREPRSSLNFRAALCRKFQQFYRSRFRPWHFFVEVHALTNRTKEESGQGLVVKFPLNVFGLRGMDKCEGDVLRSTKAATAIWRTRKNADTMWTYSREITDPNSTSGADECRRDPTTAKRGAEAGRSRLVLSQILLRRRAWMNTIGTRRNERKAELSRLVFGGEVEKWKTVDIGRRHSYGADGLVKRVDGEALLPYERRRRSNRLRQPMLGAPSQCRHIHGADGFGGEIPVG